MIEANKLNIDFITINTCQHTKTLTDIERIFDFKPTYNLEVQSIKYSNSELLGNLINDISNVIITENVSAILAQGDTLSVLAASTVAFWSVNHFFILKQVYEQAL